MNYRRIIGVFIALFGLLCMTQAEDRWAYLYHQNELRVGWGDQLFESLMWHNPTSVVTTMPADYRQVYHEDYQYDQHVWLEYQRRFKSWFGFGVMGDFSHVRWNDVTRDGHGVEVARSDGHDFYNIVLMPTFRFTYLHHPNVNLYSGFGVGLDINGGTETNAQGKTVDLGAAVNFTVIGMSVNYERWFWTLDFGGMYALKNANAIFLASSRIINVGFGARF